MNNFKIYITVIVYNICALAAWVFLAVTFDRWWIALFSILFICFPTTLRMHRRKCDGCGKYGEFASSRSEAITLAEKAGWLHIPEGDLDYCPECREKFNN